MDYITRNIKMVMKYFVLTILPPHQRNSGIRKAASFMLWCGGLFLAGAVIVPFQAQALTISPVKMEISGDPGQILQGELKLFNEQDETKTFYSSAENFEARGETGAPFFLPEKVGLATWIKTEAQVILKPKEEKTIHFSILIPQNTEPGGYFAAILWGQTPPEAKTGGQVAVGGRLGALILLKVSGAVEEGGGLLEFSATDKFFSSLPITFAYRFNNTGGDRIVPHGEIKIKNLFGFTSVILPVNKKEGSVLPNSARKFEVMWKSRQQAASDTEQDKDKELSAGVLFAMAGRQWSEFHFGWYTAKMNLVYGATNQTATAKYNFFIIPWQLLLLIAAILAIIGFLGRTGIKKWDRYIISKAMRRKKK